MGELQARVSAGRAPPVLQFFCSSDSGGTDEWRQAAVDECLVGCGRQHQVVERRPLVPECHAGCQLPLGAAPAEGEVLTPQVTEGKAAEAAGKDERVCGDGDNLWSYDASAVKAISPYAVSGPMPGQ